jgi:UDPglucose 6-dehydrogenase
MRVAVIGTGHVGLAAAVTLAEFGHRVVGIDSDSTKIGLLADGIAPFHEPGLADMLNANIARGRLSFSTSISDLNGAEVVFICVGTPAKATGEADLIAVERVARQVANSLDGGDERVVLVQKSTVPAGTAGRVQRAVRLENARVSERIEVVANPEFLQEGQAVRGSLQPDRILVGADSVHAFAVMRRLYQAQIENGINYIETDVRTAEIAKHACNAFLALKISYVNALARLCELAGGDVVQVAEIMGADPRIGRSFLEAGLGFGGYCLPKDIQAFERLAAESGYDFPLLREIARLNQEALEGTLAKIRNGLWNLEDKRICLLGLSFKPGTDDVRFAPALALARRLLAEGARVVGHDPQANANAKNEVPELEIAQDPYEAARDAHCLVVCTDWPEFSNLDLVHLKRIMSHPLVVDGRNLLTPSEMATAGIIYFPTGRPPIDFDGSHIDVGLMDEAAEPP